MPLPLLLAFFCCRWMMMPTLRKVRTTPGTMTILVTRMLMMATVLVVGNDDAELFVIVVFRLEQILLTTAQ